MPHATLMRGWLSPDNQQALAQMPWPGNIRQLENTCRWLTVMAASQEILPQDLPADLLASLPPSVNNTAGEGWQRELSLWANSVLHNGKNQLLSEAQQKLERTLIRVTLNHTQSHRQEAARLLGWGRNTLTRKIKELALEE